MYSTDSAKTAAANECNDDSNYESEKVNIHAEEPTQKTDIIFNFSSIKLTHAMRALLNRALNFSVLPIKLDITQVLVYFNRFARAAIWHEYWFGRDKDKDYSKFKSHKNSLPKTIPHPLA